MSTAAPTRDWSRRGLRTLPSWGLSLAAHVGVFWLLMTSFRPSATEPRGVEAGPDRVVGLVSREYRPGPVEQSTSSPSEEASPAAAGSTSAPPSGVETAEPRPQADQALSVPLDLPRETIRPRSGLGMGPVPSLVEGPVAPSLVQGTVSTDSGGATSTGTGPGRASFFGASARGDRITYVVDASGSMADFGAMAVAKAELMASLERLVPEQRFQIVFYNNTPRAYSPDTGRKGLPRATAIEKEKARQFVRAQQPELGTVHMDALRLALAGGPDVIFLLTDAGTAMSLRDLETLKRLNSGGCQIHSIEFGRGADLSGDENFLKKLARQNGGQYRYRDVETFPSGRSGS